jgi:cytochrome c nitrite reductase small subunit
MIKFIKKLMPPPKWKIPFIFLMGIIFGLSAFLFYISKAHTYLNDEPSTCMNCHIMAPQYSTWFHSSHRERAVCNDCHVPHNNFLNHYYFKAKDGLRHATIFTLRAEPQVIFIKKAGQDVVQQNCIRCHGDMLNSGKTKMYTHSYDDFRSERHCWECHRDVPHGRVNSLSSVPNARVPKPGSAVPEWLKQMMNKNK